MTAAGGALALVGWASIGTGVSLWQHHQLVDQRAEIAEAKIAYDRVRADLEQYRVRVGELARGIFARQRAIEAGDAPPADLADAEAGSDRLEVDLEALAEIGARIEGAFDRIATDLDLTEADRRRIVQSRDALHDRIRALESALAAANERGDALGAEAASLTDALAEARAAEDAAQIRADGLERLLGDARVALAASERRETALRGRVSALADALDGAERQTRSVSDERDGLRRRLDGLRHDLAESRRQRQAATRRIEGVVRELAEISERGLTLDGRRDALQALELQAGGVVSDLQHARRRADSAETTLAEVVFGLARLAEESGAVRAAATDDVDGAATPELLAALSPQAGGAGADSLPSGRDPVARAESLLDEIEGLHASQRSLVERLSTETEANLVQTEALLRLAGLDIDDLLRRVGFAGGQGGPMIAADMHLVAAASETFADDVKLLESRIQRWRALQEVVRCVPLIAPVDNYHVTSAFGKRKDPFNGKWAMHEGVDLGGWPGTRVLAAAPGTVVEAGRQNGYGNKVVIDHGCGIRTVYAHLRKITVKNGQTVDHREVIGKLGSTGRSTGPHVHYEVQVDGAPLDPEKFIEAGKHVFKI